MYAAGLRLFKQLDALQGRRWSCAVSQGYTVGDMPGTYCMGVALFLWTQAGLTLTGWCGGQAVKRAAVEVLYDTLLECIIIPHS